RQDEIRPGLNGLNCLSDVLRPSIRFAEQAIYGLPMPANGANI
ncbi:uncharacterized protein METZ01_LOCUS231919, partial [marine metagenome]